MVRDRRLALAVTAALALWALGAALASVRNIPRVERLGDAMLWPSLLALLLALGLLQVFESPSVGERELMTMAGLTLGAALLLALAAFVRRGLALTDLIAVVVIGLGAGVFALYTPQDDMARRLLGGILVIIAALWAVYQAQTGTHRVGKAFGFTAFGAEIIYLYVVTIGSVMETALAFLGGGVLFILLATVLYQVDRRLAARLAPKADVPVAPMAGGDVASALGGPPDASASREGDRP